MSVLMINGIGYGSRSGAFMIDMSALQPATPIPQTAPSQLITTNSPLAPWGANNHLPKEMITDIESCGILNSIIDSQARFAIGEGVQWAYTRKDAGGKKEVVEFCNVQEILDFMEDNNHYNQEYALARDMIGLGNGVVRYMLTGDRNKIAAFQRDDVSEMRLRQMDEKGKIANIYLCAEWDKVNTINDNRIIAVPLLNFNNPLNDLRKREAGYQFAMCFRYPGWNKKYYSLPLWYAALKWVKIAQGVPAMKAAIFENNFRPKYQVVFYKEFWDGLVIPVGKDSDGKELGKNFNDYTEGEQLSLKQTVYNQVEDYLMGNDNAYKTIFTDGWVDVQSGKAFKHIEIIPIENKTADGELLPDSAAANSEIAFSMKYNPAILGASLPSGPYTNSQGGSNVRESVAVQIITHEAERQHIISLYNFIKRYNKWDVEYKKEGLTLEPIIPATILTTLDTGAGTKPVMMGAQESNNNSNNNQLKK